MSAPRRSVAIVTDSPRPHDHTSIETAPSPEARLGSTTDTGAPAPSDRNALTVRADGHTVQLSDGNGDAVLTVNALASDVGVDPVAMGSGLWPAVHVQVVTRMAESANAAAIGALAS